MFTSSLREAMPFLLYVVGELERRNLPGEFALLPYVESRYRPLPAKDRGPAGLWQLMGRTAVAQGLQVDKDYDQRLDVIASTRVALDLIERYDREFGDWRLATMAFNAGEFRVKRQLGNRSTKNLSAKELGLLKLNPTTHEHLNRLLALACIVEQPETYGVELPEPEKDDVLEHLQLDSPIDLRLAASLLDMPFDELRRFNAAWRGNPGHLEPVAGMLVPAHRVARFEENLRLIPNGQRADWHEHLVQPGDTLAALSSSGSLSLQALAAANGLAADKGIAVGTRILLPGRNTRSGADPAIHIVKQGDTLSEIANRHGVGIGQLLRWNSLKKNSILHLNMQLQIRAPQY
jgi:membrane-bound lytic murein transglycosylase D